MEAIVFQPKSPMQLDLLSKMAQQMRISYRVVPNKEAGAIRRSLKAETIAAIKEAESGTCTRYNTIEDYLKDFS